MKINEINGQFLSAVIIKGDPNDIDGNEQANTFYDDLKTFLQDLGFSVVFDAGIEFTTPKSANLWIGHSRGADRLRFAPPGICLIGINTPQAKEGDDFPILNNRN